MNWFLPKYPQQTELKNFTVLVGKKPTKAKRIRSNWTIDMTAGDVKGCPAWLQDARDFVMRTRQTVNESHQASGVNVAFGDPNLFEKMTIEAPKSDLRKFVVFSGGSADEPTTLLSFTMYSPFSTDLCRWMGQMAGEEFTSTYESAIPDEDESEDGELSLSVLSEDADEDEDDEEDMDDSEDEDMDGAEALTSSAATGDEYERARRAATSARNDDLIVAVPAPKPSADVVHVPNPDSPADIARAKKNLMLM